MAKGGSTIVGNEALSWSQAGPEDCILLNKYLLQGLSCLSYMTKLHPGMHSSMNIRNDVMNHGYKIWSVAILRPDFILPDRDRKWKQDSINVVTDNWLYDSTNYEGIQASSCRFLTLGSDCIPGSSVIFCSMSQICLQMLTLLLLCLFGCLR